MQRENEPLSILAVDDEPMILEFLRTVLETEGCHIDGCIDAFEALDRIASRSYDLVITDQKMPLMKGDDFAQIVKAANPNLPILLLSGDVDTLNPTERQASCYDCILEKPIGVAHLRDAVKALLAAGNKPA
jgi:CheY-like chemotaxis protein